MGHQANTVVRLTRTLRRHGLVGGLVVAGVVVTAGEAPALASEPRMMAATALNTPDIPARAPDGSFLTINQGVDPLRALWHVRAALNVAALGCEGAGRQATIAAYNRFLKAQRTPLAAANAAIVTRYKAQYGAAWTVSYDAYMTSLYNFFSQPFVKSAFCAAAQPIAAETAAVTPASAIAFAAGALPRLEAPFTDFYARYAAYEVALADYNSRFAGGAARGAPPPPVSPLLGYASVDVGTDWQPSTGLRVAVSSLAPRVAPPPGAPRLAMVMPETALALPDGPRGAAPPAAKPPAALIRDRPDVAIAASAAPAAVAAAHVARPRSATMYAATASERMMPVAVQTAITRVPVPDVARIDPALSYRVPN